MTFDGINLVEGQLVLGVTVLAAVAMSLQRHLVAAALSAGALFLCALAFLDIAGAFADGDQRNVGWALYAEASAQGLLIIVALIAVFRTRKPING